MSPLQLDSEVSRMEERVTAGPGMHAWGRRLQKQRSPSGFVACVALMPCAEATEQESGEWVVTISGSPSSCPHLSSRMLAPAASLMDYPVFIPQTWSFSNLVTITSPDR